MWHSHFPCVSLSLSLRRKKKPPTRPTLLLQWSSARSSFKISTHAWPPYSVVKGCKDEDGRVETAVRRTTSFQRSLGTDLSMKICFLALVPISMAMACVKNISMVGSSSPSFHGLFDHHFDCSHMWRIFLGECECKGETITIKGMNLITIKKERRGISCLKQIGVRC